MDKQELEKRIKKQKIGLYLIISYFIFVFVISPVLIFILILLKINPLWFIWTIIFIMIILSIIVMILIGWNIPKKEQLLFILDKLENKLILFLMEGKEENLKLSKQLSYDIERIINDLINIKKSDFKDFYFSQEIIVFFTGLKRKLLEVNDFKNTTPQYEVEHFKNFIEDIKIYIRDEKFKEGNLKFRFKLKEKKEHWIINTIKGYWMDVKGFFVNMWENRAWFRRKAV